MHHRGGIRRKEEAAEAERQRLCGNRDDLDNGSSDEESEAEEEEEIGNADFDGDDGTGRLLYMQ